MMNLKLKFLYCKVQRNISSNRNFIPSPSNSNICIFVYKKNIQRHPSKKIIEITGRKLKPILDLKAVNDMVFIIGNGFYAVKNSQLLDKLYLPPKCTITLKKMSLMHAVITISHDTC